MITFFRIATVLVVSLSPVAGIAQYRAEDEAKVMAFMARIGRDDAVIRSLEVKDDTIRVHFRDGGMLLHSLLSPTLVMYSNYKETKEASRRSMRESPRFSATQMEERAWSFLPEGESRSGWRVERAMGFVAGYGERCGNYCFELAKLNQGLPSAGDSLTITLDGYEGKVLTFSQLTGFEGGDPPASTIPIEEARAIAVRALDRIEHAETRGWIKHEWAAQPPTWSQRYVVSGGGSRGPYSDPVVAEWPKRMRLRWVFRGPGGEVGIDAETGAVCYVGLMMDAGADKTVRRPLSRALQPVSGSRSDEEDRSYPWLWGLAAIPVALGAWLVVRARG